MRRIVLERAPAERPVAVPDEVLGVEAGPQGEAAEQVFRAGARRVEPGLNARPETWSRGRPHVGAGEGVRRAGFGPSGPASISRPQLKLSLRSGSASSYIFVEPGPSQPWWNRFVRASCLAAGRQPEELEPRAARRFDGRGVHPVVADVEEAHLGSGPGERGADPARIAAVAQGPDIDHRHLVGGERFGSRGGELTAARRRERKRSRGPSSRSAPRAGGIPDCRTRKARRPRCPHRLAARSPPLTFRRIDRAHRAIRGPAARSPPAARCVRDPWYRERCARPPGPPSAAAQRRPRSRPARAR